MIHFCNQKHTSREGSLLKRKFIASPLSTTFHVSKLETTGMYHKAYETLVRQITQIKPKPEKTRDWHSHRRSLTTKHCIICTKKTPSPKVVILLSYVFPGFLQTKVACLRSRIQKGGNQKVLIHYSKVIEDPRFVAKSVRKGTTV